MSANLFCHDLYTFNDYLLFRNKSMKHNLQNVVCKVPISRLQFQVRQTNLKLSLTSEFQANLFVVILTSDHKAKSFSLKALKNTYHCQNWRSKTFRWVSTPLGRKLKERNRLKLCPNINYCIVPSSSTSQLVTPHMAMLLTEFEFNQ